MNTRPYLLCNLLCLLFLWACTPKNSVSPSVPSFPDQPATALAKTLAQSTSADMKRKNFAINGGWGYTHHTAVILTSPPGRGKNAYNNTVPLESLLVRARNEVEFSETPPTGQRYVVVDHGTISRTVREREGKMYAVWRGQMHLVSEREAPDLYARVRNLPLPHRAAQVPTLRARAVPREYWFDITETFNLKRGSKTATSKTQPAKPIQPAAPAQLVLPATPTVPAQPIKKPRKI